MDIATFINYDVKNRRNTLQDLSSINSHVALIQGAPREEMSQEQDETRLFFVAENPSSQADTARNRAVIRSQITKSYWRQTRRGRGGVNEPAHRHLRTSPNSGPERPRRRSAGGWNEVDGDDRSSEQQTHSNSRSWGYSLQQQENSGLHASQQDGTRVRTFGDNDSSHSHNPFEAPDEFPLPPNPNSLLGSGSEDPFRSYPSQLEPSSVAKLTHHCERTSFQTLYKPFGRIKASALTIEIVLDSNGRTLAGSTSKRPWRARQSSSHTLVRSLNHEPFALQCLDVRCRNPFPDAKITSATL